MSEAESTTVDVLIARLSTHPEEFFVAEAVITQDGARIFAGTKWRRITTMLMTPMNGEMHLWIEMFSDEEKARFRTAMLEALRGVIDTQMMKVLTGGDPVELDPEEKQRRQAAAVKNSLLQQYNIQKHQMVAQQMNALGAMANQNLSGILESWGGAGGAGAAGSGFPLDKSYDEYLERERERERKERAKAAAEPPPLSLRDKVKKYFP